MAEKSPQLILSWFKYLPLSVARVFGILLMLLSRTPLPILRLSVFDHRLCWECHNLCLRHPRRCQGKTKSIDSLVKNV
jgi:hypothetical protein